MQNRGKWKPGEYHANTTMEDVRGVCMHCFIDFDGFYKD